MGFTSRNHQLLSTLSRLGQAFFLLGLGVHSLSNSFVSGAVVDPAEQWPQFRGPNASGVASGKAFPPVDFGPEKSLAWKVALPSGHSSPCVWGDRLFVTAVRTNDQKLLTLCLQSHSGNVLWEQVAQAQKIEEIDAMFSPNTPASSTPATDGSVVVSYFGSHGLIAHDFQGKLLWERPLSNTSGMHGSGSSPIIADQWVVIDLHMTKDPCLLAVSLKDGQTAWKTALKPGDRGWATPIDWTEEGEKLIGLLTPGRFTAYRLKDGKEKWWVTGLSNETCSTPVLGSGNVYMYSTHELGEAENIHKIPTFDEMLQRFDSNHDQLLSTDEVPEDFLVVERQFSGKSYRSGNFSLRDLLLFDSKEKVIKLDRANWLKNMEGIDQFIKECTATEPKAIAVRCGGTGDVTKTNLLWTEKKGLPQVASELFYQDRLYFIRNDGIVTCRDAASGRLIYQERTGVAGGYYASPIVADGKIYTASDRGVVAVFTAGPEFKVLARNDLKEPIFATPAMANGTLYVRTVHHLYAFK